MFTPVVIPCNFCSTESTGTFFSMSARKVLADPVKDDFEKFPYPVTTTSSRLSDSGCNTTFKTPFFGTLTSDDFIPI